MWFLEWFLERRNIMLNINVEVDMIFSEGKIYGTLIAITSSLFDTYGIVKVVNGSLKRYSIDRIKIIS
jgi:hypothetical protein